MHLHFYCAVVLCVWSRLFSVYVYIMMYLHCAFVLRVSIVQLYCAFDGVCLMCMTLCTYICTCIVHLHCVSLLCLALCIGIGFLYCAVVLCVLCCMFSVYMYVRKYVLVMCIYIAYFYCVSHCALAVGVSTVQLYCAFGSVCLVCICT